MSIMASELFPLSGRIKLLSNPDALPAKCAICGYPGGDQRKFVDFGLDIDYYGVIYLCTDCMNEIAVGIGYLLPEVVTKITAENELLKEALKVAQADQEILYELRTHLGLFSGTIHGPVLDESLVDTDPIDVVEEINEPDRETDNPVNVEGPDDSSDTLHI